MSKELNGLAEVVDLNHLFTILVNKKYLSAVTRVAELMRNNFKLTTVFKMNDNFDLGKTYNR